MTITDDMVDLKPCPFCGGDDIGERYVRDGRQMFCGDCGASVRPTFHGPKGDTVERAVAAWNTRAALEGSVALPAWQPIETAPKDGTEIWAWLYDSGVRLMRWSTAEENAAEEGGDPDDFLSCWVDCSDPSEDWSPKFWLPYEAFNVPPGCVFVRGRWRDATSEIPRHERGTGS